MVVNIERNHQRDARDKTTKHLSVYSKKIVNSKRDRSLKQKFDNTKTSQYLIELTMYLTHLDPLTTTEQTIKDKIINVCV